MVDKREPTHIALIPASQDIFTFQQLYLLQVQTSTKYITPHMVPFTRPSVSAILLL